MFNPFKKSQPKEVAVMDYPEIVHQIHREFNTAGEQILKEAEAILTDCKLKDKEKGKLLAKLGFVNTPQAKEVSEVERKELEAKNNAELVNYYSQKYPLNKFITESVVKQICEKYGLVCGDVALYKGFVPVEKLKQISRFTVKEEDKPFAKLIGDKGEVLTSVEKSECKRDYWGIAQGKSATFERGNATSEEFSARINSYFDNNKYLRCEGYNHSLQICAPLKDMDAKGYELKGHKLVKHIPDPVVLQPVNGGYLIVCAWGDEANDENVVNQKMN